MKYVLFYESASDFLQKVPANAAAHRAHWQAAAAEGVLLMIGPFADPAGGAMGVFTTKEAAHAFAERDPFVTGGVVARWHVKEWIEVVVEER